MFIYTERNKNITVLFTFRLVLLSTILLYHFLHAVASMTIDELKILDNVINSVPKQSDYHEYTEEIENILETHKTQSENKVHGFRENQLVVPIRLHHETGHPVTHGRHFRRRSKNSNSNPKKRRKRESRLEHVSEHLLRDIARQHDHKNQIFDGKKETYFDVIPDKYSDESLDFIGEDTEEYLDHRVANYSLKAFGNHFLFHLTPYEDFLAPNYSLRFLGDPKKDKPLYTEVPRHCFYSGYVNGKRNHKAILSVCRGLFGAFHTDKSDYLIQPESLGSHPSHDENDEEGTKPHRIFRRSIPPDEQRVRQLCGFMEPENQPQTVQQYSIGRNHNDSFFHDHYNQSGILRNEFESRRRAEEIRRRSSREQSRLRSRLQSVLSESNFKASTSILRNLGVNNLINSRQVLETLKGRKQKIFLHPVAERIKRRRRYLSHARHVEVMVTADNSMLRLHDDVEHYVLTLMAIVNHVYHDPSIENLINIVVVELVVIGDSQVQNGPRVVRDAHSCLKNFCLWQYQHNNQDDTHPSHHDTAVLITGKDICRTESACDTLGLAELGTICDSRRSCSINEDNGLSTAFTIAHEIGHEFNAHHDNSEKCQDSNGKTVSLNVMSPTLDHSAHPWTWSKCSAKYITSFLDNGHGQCLLDDPPQRVLSLPLEEPGEVFDANDQCGFVYGKGVTHCNFMFQNTCQRLWCVSQNVTHGCRTPHVPWADGTRCGHRLWCQRGQCVPENRQRLPIDGSWGEWSRFGECSRTCGGGVKSSYRECNNPEPQHGGNYCTGRRKKYRPCNHQDCPEGSDIRAEQCASFNDWSRHHKHRVNGIAVNAEWIPKYDGIPEKDRCKLICQVRSREQYSSPWYILKPKVINGTPCGPDTHDICVEGLCKPAGCDHILNSDTKEDNCGICNGNNSDCTVVEGSYNTGYNIGYNQVVVIPNGSTNIIITQRSYSGDPNDNNYLALRDTRGSYILNGNRSVMKNKLRIKRRSNDRSRKYAYYCDYSGTAGAIERINCSKTIGIDLVVEVLSAGDLMPPDINYSYNIPIRATLYYGWNSNGRWSECSKICNGRTKQEVICVRSDGQVVSKDRCNHLRKPAANIRSCNTKCELVWHRAPSRCSVRCGTGTMKLNYECKKISNFAADEVKTTDTVTVSVDESFCSQPKPDEIIRCRGDCLPSSWKYGDWSKCSQTCGGGTQTRMAICQDSRGTIFSQDQCNDEDKVASRHCFVEPCPRWISSRWTDCSTTCGNGIQRRRVWCAVSNLIRPDKECNRSRPFRVIPCKNRECPVWRYEEWGPCSATCGEGVSSRSYLCVDEGGATVNSSFCNSSLLQNTRSCFSSRSCNENWTSRDAGNGSPFLVVRRVVGLRPDPTTTTATDFSNPISFTVSPVVRSNYISMIDPNVHVVNSYRVVARWRTGSWTQCSKSCGSGIRLRYVSCRSVATGSEMEDEVCGREEFRPPSREDCQTRACSGEWKSGSWSHCSASCGIGTRSRYVGCLYNGQYERNSPHCLSKDKPAEREECHVPVTCFTSSIITTTLSSSITTEKRQNEVDLNNEQEFAKGRWRTGAWSKCSTLCGNGTRKRAVVCQSLSAGQNGACDPEKQPTNLQACVGTECPNWRQDQWGKCSRTCGVGTRTRKIYCITPRGAYTYESQCDVAKRPKEVSHCNVKSCRKAYRWRKSAWGMCSTSCGRGIKVRQVHCVDRRGNAVNQSLCTAISRSRPRHLHRCMVQKRCPKWRTGKWGLCSATCGEGEQRRKVTCRYKTKIILKTLCNENKRPVATKRCNIARCSTYEWHAADWSECSTRCGEGSQHREINCRAIGSQRPVDDIICLRSEVENKPPSQKVCLPGPCTASWKIGLWSECSHSCGPGNQRREVTCTYLHPLNYTELDVSTCDVTRKPSTVRECDHGSCGLRYYWRVGSWSQCSATCGEGKSVRRVVCSDRVTQSPQQDNICQSSSSSQPERSRKCRARPCVPNSCLQLKNQHGVHDDGDYFLKVHDKMLQVYCKDMNTSQPLDYLTLLSGREENYSEIFGFRLLDADRCPSNGTRDPNCACRRDHPDEGYTTFEKVRLDISSMRIIANDYSFAHTRFGKPVAFGVAGDCYSRVNCAQGVFRINLKGTGLVVSDETTWRSYGIDSTMRIYRSIDGDIVSGNCGGYCSRCQPDPSSGLLLRHNTIR